MKRIIKHFGIDTVSLYLSSIVASGLTFDEGLKTLLLAGLGLSLSSFVVKPIINLFMLPINLITFGIFRWVSSAIALYIVTLVVPGFLILGFTFAGYQNVWFSLPAVSLNGVIAIVVFSFLISLISGIIYWLVN